MIDSNRLLLHILDVDMRGSGILLQTQQHNILIDLAFETGTNKIIEYLTKLGVENIDILVITHPHRDHMAGQGQGGLSKFINKFSIGEIWSNGIPLPTWYDGITTSPDGPDSVEDYNAYLTQIFPNGYTVGGLSDYPTIQGASMIPYTEPKAGDVFTYGDLSIKILNPPRPHTRKNTNSSSIVMQLIYKGKKIMLCGDSLVESENDIMGRFTSEELKSDILYLGHHGIDDATSSAWLNAVNPSIVTLQRRDRDKDTTRIWDMLESKNIAVYDVYMNELWGSADSSKFVNYVFDVSETDIQVYTETIKPTKLSFFNFNIKYNEKLQMAHKVLIKQNDELATVKDVFIKQ